MFWALLPHHHRAHNCIEQLQPDVGPKRLKTYSIWFFNIIVILIKLCAFVGLNYYNPILSLINVTYLGN